jgi:hypothetical protein
VHAGACALGGLPIARFGHARPADSNCGDHAAKLKETSPRHKDIEEAEAKIITNAARVPRRESQFETDATRFST